MLRTSFSLTEKVIANPILGLKAPPSLEVQKTIRQRTYRHPMMIAG